MLPFELLEIISVLESVALFGTRVISIGRHFRIINPFALATRVHHQHNTINTTSCSATQCFRDTFVSRTTRGIATVISTGRDCCLLVVSQSPRRGCDNHAYNTVVECQLPGYLMHTAELDIIQDLF
jgi:hypothetical protein